MKSDIIYPAFIALTLVAGGCTQTDSPDYDHSEALNDVILNFNVTLNATGSRQTRKLDSSDCSQHVTDMRIYVFRSETGAGDASFTYYRPMVGDSSDPQDYFGVGAFADDETHISEKRYTITSRLPKGYYRFLAVGRDDDAGSGEDNISTDWAAGATTWNEAVISTKDPYLSGEVFTGYPLKLDDTPATFHVKDAAGFSTSIDLYRAVAGVLLYVENLPDVLESDFSWNATRMVESEGDDGTIGEIEETYTIVRQGAEYQISEIAVVAPGYNNAMNLCTRHWTDNSFIAETQEFINTRLVSIPMADIRTDWAHTKDADGYYGISRRIGSFVMPAQLKGHTVELRYVPDAQDRAEVIYTFPASMYLAFFTEVDGRRYPVKMLNVRDSSQTIHLPGGLSFYTPEELAVERTQYNLICNNIYCLGDFRTEGTPIDEPIDLKKVLNKGELNITVIGNWQADVDINL